MSTDNIKRFEVKLPSSVIERLDIAARKKKWSRKKYVEEVLKDHVKTKKTVMYKTPPFKALKRAEKAKVPLAT